VSPLKLFLNTHPATIWIAVNLSLTYLFFSINFMFHKIIGIYLGVISIISLIIMLIIIKFLYKSKKNDLIKEIDKKEFKEFKENVFNKYNGENKYNYENKTLEGIFIKIEQAKELLDKRFSFSSIIKDRIKDLMFDYLNLAIKNFDLIKDMRKTAENSSHNYGDEINALCRENDEISKNLDNLIREFFIDQKGEDNISELNESLLRSLELFERMRKK
jgi:hypothetical protein